MTQVLLVVGGFLAGSGVTAMVARYFFLLGWEKARDDQALDPGEVTGRLPAVGESSGRHARIEWPAGDTVQFGSVTP